MIGDFSALLLAIFINFGMSFLVASFITFLILERESKVSIVVYFKADFMQATIFARNYGTAAVILYNLKGIAPPVPPVQCWIDKNLMSGCEAPTLKRVGGGRVGKMYQ